LQVEDNQLDVPTVIDRAKDIASKHVSRLLAILPELWPRCREPFQRASDEKRRAGSDLNSEKFREQAFDIRVPAGVIRRKAKPEGKLSLTAD